MSDFVAGSIHRQVSKDSVLTEIQQNQPAVSSSTAGSTLPSSVTGFQRIVRTLCGAFCYAQWAIIFGWSIPQLYFQYKVMLQLNTK